MLNSDQVNRSQSPKSTESNTGTLKRPFLNQQNSTEHSEGDEENNGPGTNHKKQIKKA